ncbi:MAG: SufS family cysteine desulfurase [Bacteroidales bacterium]|nr:SufS family cysteine desulfurase [Bacteroidales bacterium]
MTVKDFRQLFPILNRQIYGRNLVYFDNAATSQRPQSVVEKFTDLSLYSNANIYRAVHTLATEATEYYEKAREASRAFINASSREEIIFTSGCTAAINLVAYSFGEAFVGEGDEIIVCEAEHHSNMVPWQALCQRKKAHLRILPIDDRGHLDLQTLSALLAHGGSRVKLLALAHISNILGLVNPVEEVIALCHAAGVPVLLDGAQGIVHEKVDVRALDCDFYAYSGHKIYAATGTGVLYGKKEWLEKMPPFLFGGEMVETVNLQEATYAPLPLKFEAGTGNFAAVATLPQAYETALAAREPEIEAAFAALCQFVESALLSRTDVRLYGIADEKYKRCGVFSFTVEGVHHEDLAHLLDKMGVAVRSGQMCAEPAVRHFGVQGMVRVSLAPYNTIEEAQYFMSALDRAVNMLR